MRFAHPQVLWLILLLPLLVLLAWARLRAATGALRRALSPAMAERLTCHLSPARRTAGLFLLVLACLFLILGAARPQRGTQYVTAARRGVDVMVALDLSESMLAEDLKPNRLVRARHEISAILDRLQGDRMGLVAFAGAAFVQCPLTLDYSAARMFLEFMGPDLIPEPGTGIAEALRVSVRAFDPAGEGFRALILITDGEDHLGDVEAAARDARKAGVRVFTVGIGSKSGEPIPQRDDEGRIEGYKKDRSGKVVLTKLDEQALRKIAEITGGLYVRASATLGLDRIMSEIGGMEKRELEGGVRVLYEERYTYFVWPAILLLLAQWWIPIRKRVWAGRSRIAAGLVLLCLVPVLAGAMGPGGSIPGPPEDEALPEEEWAKQLEENQVRRARRPKDPRPLYNLGNLYYLKGDFPEAEGFYEVAAGRSQKALGSKVAYNLGNTLYKSGEFEEARDAFARALGLDPGNEDAKINLELTQKLLDQLAQEADSSCRQESPDRKPGEGEESEEGQESDQDEQGSQESPENQGRQDQQDRQDQSSQNDGEQENRPEQDGASSEENAQQDERDESPEDEALGRSSPTEPDSLTEAQQMQLMQILKGLEAAERELLKKRFHARSRNLEVEKDW